VSGIWFTVCYLVRVVDGVTSQIERYMDLLSARQKLVASNIANIDTPGYKAKDVDFQLEFLSLAEGQTPHVIDSPGLVIKSDGNNVSIDRETRLLAENALRFSVASSLMKTQLKMVEAAIKEGQSS
jgi:flagellar basal-body rod protein FlgB